MASRKLALPPLDEAALADLTSTLARLSQAPPAAHEAALPLPSPPAPKAEPVVEPTAGNLAVIEPPEAPKPEFGAYVDPRWRELAVLRVKHRLVNNRECAFKIGVSAVTVGIWLKKPLYQAYERWVSDRYVDSLPPEIKRQRREVQKKFEDNAGEMQDRLLEILETTNDNKLAASIAHDWLDRAGHSPIKTKQTTHVHQFSDEKLAELFKRAEEIGSPIVEGEVVEESKP